MKRAIEFHIDATPKEVAAVTAVHDPQRLIVLADDLSGAVEVAALLVDKAGNAPRVLLNFSPESLAAALETPGALVIDMDLRNGTHLEARSSITAILASLPAGVELFCKIDSLIRGPVRGIIEALSDQHPVLCTAVPDTHRTLRGGVVHLGTHKLHETDAWAIEPRSAPKSVLELLGGQGQLVSLEDVRSAALAMRLITAAGTGVAVADAESHRDLNRIAAKAPGVLIGAAGLARAWAEQHGHRALPDTRSVQFTTTSYPLGLIGTASATARDQFAYCQSQGVTVMRPSVEQLPTANIAADESTIVAGPGDLVDPASVERGFAALSKRVPSDRNLVLAGGATAKAVLDSLQVSVLTPLAQVHHGAIISQAGNRLVATRPGSYGDVTSLQAVFNCLSPAT